MNIEEARELCKEEFMKNVMANLDSTLIFTYISNLEKENQQLKKKYENAVADYEYEKSKNQRAIEYMEQWGKEPDADMYMQMKDYNEFKYLLKILKEDNKEE